MDGYVTPEEILEREARLRFKEAGYEFPPHCLHPESWLLLEAEMEKKTPFEFCPSRNNGCPNKKSCHVSSENAKSFFRSGGARSSRREKINYAKDLGGI